MGDVLRVLQVEDSESDAELIVRLLRKGGYDVQAERVEDAAAMRGTWRAFGGEEQTDCGEQGGGPDVRGHVAASIRLFCGEKIARVSRLINAPARQRLWRIPPTRDQGLPRRAGKPAPHR